MRINRNGHATMHAVYRKDALPGPTGRAFISQLQF
jgi:hypothetical protein